MVSNKSRFHLVIIGDRRTFATSRLTAKPQITRRLGHVSVARRLRVCLGGGISILRLGLQQDQQTHGRQDREQPSSSETCDCVPSWIKKADYQLAYLSGRREASRPHHKKRLALYISFCGLRNGRNFWAGHKSQSSPGRLGGCDLPHHRNRNWPSGGYFFCVDPTTRVQMHRGAIMNCCCMVGAATLWRGYIAREIAHPRRAPPRRRGLP